MNSSRQMRSAGADDGDGARARIGGGGLVRRGSGEALRQGSGQRAPDAWALRRDALELGPPEAQDEAVAHGRDGGGARATGQKGDLADGLLGTDLGKRLAPSLEGHGKAPGDDDVERVGRIALAHEDVAAFQGARFELGHEGGALVGAELGEYPHGGKAGFGQKRVHQQALIAMLHHSSPAHCARAQSAALANASLLAGAKRYDDDVARWRALRRSVSAACMRSWLSPLRRRAARLSPEWQRPGAYRA